MKAGSVITCPSCGAKLLRTTKDLLPGQQMKDAGFESLGYNLQSEGARCNECMTKFVRQHPRTNKTQIHTEIDGWVSLSKEGPQDAREPDSKSERLPS